MRGSPVTLQQMLDRREARAVAQREMLKTGLPIVSFTMNLAGELKRSPQSDLAFQYGCSLLEERLGPWTDRVLTDENTGLEVIYAFDMDPAELKQICTEIEEVSPVGRLFDMDVITPSGEKLSRADARKCLVCGGPVALCSRSRAHGLDSIKAATGAILSDFTAERIGLLASEALKEEVQVTPKPGLVDMENNGAHRDMNPELFFRSAAVLRDYFTACSREGMKSDDCMPRLKELGIAAERTMLLETSGVNTHKGAIYVLGLICAAVGACSVRGGELFRRCSELASQGENVESGSHGERVRKSFPCCGPREEAVSGFPSIQEGQKYLRSGCAPAFALMGIILVCNDSNLLYRGGQAGLDFARTSAAAVLKAAEEDRVPLLRRLNTEFCERKLSPGGCADMLAAALLLNRLTVLYE